MDAIDAEQTRVAIEAGWRMRVGRKLRRTLYLHAPHEDPNGAGVCIGIVDTATLAEEIASRWNAATGGPDWRGIAARLAWAQTGAGRHASDRSDDEQRALNEYDRGVEAEKAGLL